MWDLPGPGLEPVSPALASGFLTTVPPGKPCIYYWVHAKDPALCQMLDLPNMLPITNSSTFFLPALAPFHRRRHWGLEKLSTSPKFTQLISDRDCDPSPSKSEACVVSNSACAGACKMNKLGVCQVRLEGLGKGVLDRGKGTAKLWSGGRPCCVWECNPVRPWPGQRASRWFSVQAAC